MQQVQSMSIYVINCLIFFIFKKVRGGDNKIDKQKELKYKKKLTEGMKMNIDKFLEEISLNFKMAKKW